MSKSCGGWAESGHCEEKAHSIGCTAASIVLALDFRLREPRLASIAGRENTNEAPVSGSSRSVISRNDDPACQRGMPSRDAIRLPDYIQRQAILRLPLNATGRR
jgi:hypothetical protein